MAASKTRISFLIILGALMSITSLSTDIYLPALPTMEAALGGDSELTITVSSWDFRSPNYYGAQSAIGLAEKFP